MIKKIKKYTFLEDADIAIVDDLIEIYILDYLKKLTQQNIKLKDQIKKTSNWVKTKDISSWKIFDFYSYFCIKYREKYKKDFRLIGNIVRAYEKIEYFITSNKIKNNDYKEFIDLAFSRYFNPIVIPILGNICSPSLYERLMKKSLKKVSAEELFNIDQVIYRESEKFEKEISENGITWNNDNRS